jgi:hypothetical protein
MDPRVVRTPRYNNVVQSFRGQGSQYSGAVFSTALPLPCWAQLAKHPNFLSLIKSFRYIIKFLYFYGRNYQGKLALTDDPGAGALAVHRARLLTKDRWTIFILHPQF